MVWAVVAAAVLPVGRLTRALRRAGHLLHLRCIVVGDVVVPVNLEEVCAVRPRHAGLLRRVVAAAQGTRLLLLLPDLYLLSTFIAAF